MSNSRKFYRIPERRLQGIWDALNLLRLLSTNTEPFDMVDELTSRVHWFGIRNMTSILQGALQYVHDYILHYNMRIERRRDCDAVPEKFVEIWACSLTPIHSLKQMRLQAKGKKPKRRLSSKQQRKQKPCNMGLFDAFPWLQEKQRDVQQDDLQDRGSEGSE